MDIAVDEFLDFALEALARPGADWKIAYEQGMRIAHEDPQSISTIVAVLIDAEIDALTFVDDILSFLPMDKWPLLVAIALTTLRQDAAHSSALSVLDKAALQCPVALHPYLRELLPLGERAYSSFAVHAFRETTLADVRFLLDEDTTGEPRVASHLVPHALLETRLPEAMRAVRAQGDPHVAYNLAQVGFEEAGDDFRQLYPTMPLHVCFPAENLAEQWGETEDGFGRSPREMVYHPTWAPPPPGAPRHRFGGTSARRCGRCGEPLHHLITLEPVPAGLGMTGLSRLELSVCLACLYSTEALAYQHDADGQPDDVIHRDVFITPEWPVAPSPLPEAMVAFVDLGPRWRWQDVGASNHRENLDRLGGHPTWVQYAEYPTCPRCARTMSFLLQLESEYINPDGLGYVFWCDQCKVSGVQVQQT